MPRFFLHAYTLVLAAEILARAGVFAGWEWVSKPLLMPVLLAGFLAGARRRGALEAWTAAALVLSWGGDVFLLLEAAPPGPAWLREAAGALGEEGAFLAGLGSFLLAHLAYIGAFLSGPRTAPGSAVLDRPAVIAPFLLYGGGLLFAIRSGLGEMALPVVIYTAVLTAMALAACGRGGRVPSVSFRWVFAGALIFVASDSMIAVNRFAASFDGAGTAVMLTYGVAQLLIVEGILRQRTGGRPPLREPVGREPAPAGETA